MTRTNDLTSANLAPAIHILNHFYPSGFRTYMNYTYTSFIYLYILLHGKNIYHSVLHGSIQFECNATHQPITLYLSAGCHDDESTSPPWTKDQPSWNTCAHVDDWPGRILGGCICKCLWRRVMKWWKITCTSYTSFSSFFRAWRTRLIQWDDICAHIHYAHSTIWCGISWCDERVYANFKLNSKFERRQEFGSETEIRVPKANLDKTRIKIGKE